MLLNNSSTSELSCLASRKRKLKKKRKMWLPERKQLAKQGHYFLKQWLICRDRSRTLTYIHNSPFYGNSDSYQLLTTVAKGSILDVGTGPRSLSDIHDILISYILIYPFIWGRTRVEETVWIDYGGSILTIYRFTVMNFPFLSVVNRNQKSIRNYIVPNVKHQKVVQKICKMGRVSLVSLIAH